MLYGFGKSRPETISGTDISSFQVALSGVVGILTGLLPLGNLRIPFLLLIPVLLRLRFFPLFLGYLVSALLPGISYSLIRLAGFTGSGRWMDLYNRTFSVGSMPVGEFLSRFHDPWGAWLATLASVFLVALFFFPVFHFIHRKLGSRVAPGPCPKFIFHDPAGRRWPSLVRSVAIMLLTAGLILASSASYILNDFREFEGRLQLLSAEDSSGAAGAPRETAERGPAAPAGGTAAPGEQMTYAFYSREDAASRASFDAHWESISVLLPDWFRINGDLTVTFSPSPDVDRTCSGNTIGIIPVLHDRTGADGSGNVAASLLGSPAAQTRVIDATIRAALENGYQGLCVDFRSVRREYSAQYLAFVRRVAEAFHGRNLAVLATVPAGGWVDYPLLSQSCDGLIVLQAGSDAAPPAPGPVLPIDGFKDFRGLLDVVGPDKAILSFAPFGYDWVRGTTSWTGTRKGLAELFDIALAHGAGIEWDQESGNSHFSYTDGGAEHRVWFVDSLYVGELAKLMTEKKAKALALSSMGTEDGSLWDWLEQARRGGRPALRGGGRGAPVYSYTPAKAPNTEIITRIARIPRLERRITVDERGGITGLGYEALPGSQAAEYETHWKENAVALTFDDGPDPDYTPAILDILKENKVRATFFVTGENAVKHSALVKRMADEGHELGIHTFFHTNVMTMDSRGLDRDFYLTSRAVENITGQRVKLFRPPYNTLQKEVASAHQLSVFRRIGLLGYSVVGGFIDPDDWAQLSPDEISQVVQEDATKGRIIVLHDAGGVRTSTVKALPLIIGALRSRGYQLVPVGELVSAPGNRDSTPGAAALSVRVSGSLSLFAGLWANGGTLATAFFLAVTSLTVARLALLVFFSASQKRRKARAAPDQRFQPLVSVVIAAYNEERVICKTIHSVLGSDYPLFEVIVVNDGSIDRTAEVIAAEYRDCSSVRLITKANGGKAKAVNLGIQEARGDIVVAIDADTVMDPTALSHFVRNFEDPGVCAVAGNIKVGNVRNRLTLFQHIEYVTGLNLEKRAYDRLQGIMVVPGALGAWRRDKLLEAGGFKEDTLAEDTDLTIEFVRKGYRVKYEEHALAYTEAPESIAAFIKQRTRWCYGILQCLWKHRRAFFDTRHPALGWLALPFAVFNNYLLNILSPLIDLGFLLGMVVSNAAPAALLALPLYLLFELAVYFYAFRLERVEPGPLKWLILQRFAYRYLFFYVTVRSLLKAAKGIALGWNKLNRSGNVLSRERPMASAPAVPIADFTARS